MERPKVGVGIFVFNDKKNKFLIAKRIKDDKYGLPGGKLEHSENFELCAQRELFEETNISINEVDRFEFMCSFNCIQKEFKYHWIEIVMKVFLTEEEEKMIKNMEIDKSEDWEWADIDILTKKDENKKIFYPLEMLVNKFKINTLENLKNLNEN